MRLDKWLVEKGVVPSRARALVLIEGGGVLVGGKVVLKGSCEVLEGMEVDVVGEDDGLVGRGGRKLRALLDIYPLGREMVAGAVVVDVGSSTGGFTEISLAAGAARVYAVDVGHGQLHARLREDARVVVMEGQDARLLAAEIMVPPPTVLVSDVSFISQTKILPHVVAVFPTLEVLMILVKPQFEVGREGVGKGGLVRDEALRAQALADVRACVENLGFTVDVACDCPVEGSDGNREFLLGARRRIED